MRLLNVDTLEFKEFHNKFIPPYGILSHTWANPEDEVSYEQFREFQRNLQSERPPPTNVENAGLKKILGFCEFVQRRKVFNFDKFRKVRPTGFGDDIQRPVNGESETLRWVWIDTICVDKTSSSDLSEAINSMFAWYSYSEECYVYLADVSMSEFEETGSVEAFKKARWFDRGWTQQELVAPKTRIFCSSEWRVLGQISHSSQRASYCKTYQEAASDLTAIISVRTRIDQSYLLDRDKVFEASIAERFSWAASRETTRVEDRAYCLLGLFRVNMLPLYGEGRQAFTRLQEEIIRRSSDQSIFVWKYVKDENPDQVPEDTRETVGILATHAGCFSSIQGTRNNGRRLLYPSTITNIGLKLQCPSQKVNWPSVSDKKCIFRIVKLNCEVSHIDTEGSQMYTPAEPLVIECRHHGKDELPAVYRSRCNNRLHSPTLEKLFPSRDRTKPDSYKFFPEQFSSLRKQCSKCRSYDTKLMRSLHPG